VLARAMHADPVEHSGLRGKGIYYCRAGCAAYAN
jgi:hypothetical protein